MQVSEYDKAILVAASWRLARSNDVNELLAVACTIRNWVVPRFLPPGVPPREPLNGELHYKSYSEAIQALLLVYPARELPRINEGALIDLVEGLLVKIDSVYDNSLVDVTSSRSFQGGARYFARVVDATPWFKENIIQRQDKHPLIGSFGTQQFFA